MSFPETSPSAVRRLRFGVFEVDFDNRELRKRGLRIQLQQKPFQILEFLLRTPGRLVTRTELAQHLWPGLHVNFERSLNTAMNSLRQALGDSSQSPRFIETRTGLGYCFIAPVEPLGEQREEPRLPPAAISGTGKSNLPAEVVKGRYFASKLTAEDLHKAIAQFEAALAKDSDCAAAYAGLSDAYCWFAFLNMAPAAEIYPRARELALSAIRKDKSLGEAHAALGGVKRFFEWEWDDAERHYRRAVELSPDSAIVRQAWGSYLAAVGRPQEAIRELQRVAEIDPLSSMPNAAIAWSLYMAGDFEGASEQSWNALVAEPRLASAQLTLGLAYEQMGMAEDAIVEFGNARQCAGDQPAVLAALAHAFAIAGRQGEATEIFRELQQLSGSRSLSPYWQSVVYTGLRDHRHALESLERAHEARDVWVTWLKAEPRFAPLRAERRFEALLQSIGLARAN